MSWAGKKSLKDSFKSLFHKKEQALSLPVETTRPQLSPQKMARMEKLLQKWVSEKGYRMPDSSIEEAADRIGTDTLTLFRYFSSRGEDFRSFRTRLRLEDAKKMLLEEPDTPSSTIALRVGYKDRSNFTRHFKAHTGLTPNAWREKIT